MVAHSFVAWLNTSKDEEVTELFDVPPDITCLNIDRLLPLYLDGEVDETAATRVEEHLEVCTQCHQEFEKLEKTDALLRSNASICPPATLFEQIQARIDALSGKRHPFLKLMSVGISNFRLLSDSQILDSI